MANSSINPIRQTTPEEEEALRRLTSTPVSSQSAVPGLPSPPPGMQVTPVILEAGLKTNIAKPYQQRGGPVGRPTPATTPLAKATAELRGPPKPAAQPTAAMGLPGQQLLRTPSEQAMATAPFAIPKQTQPKVVAPTTQGGMTHTVPHGEGVSLDSIRANRNSAMFPGAWESKPRELTPRDERNTLGALWKPTAPPAAPPPATAAPAASTTPYVPYSPVGPNQVEQDIGRPMPPPGMVEVIRPSKAGGFQFTNEMGSDVRPVGMDPRTAQEVSGFRNAGLTPPEQLQGIEILRGAETEARQADAQMLAAQAQGRVAEARMIEANRPSTSRVSIPDLNDPMKSEVGIVVTDANGRSRVQNLKVIERIPIDERRKALTYEVPDKLGNPIKKVAVFDLVTGEQISESDASGSAATPDKVPPMPRDIDAELAPYWQEAVAEGLKYTNDPQKAAEIAATALRNRKPLAETVK